MSEANSGVGTGAAIGGIALLGTAGLAIGYAVNTANQAKEDVCEFKGDLEHLVVDVVKLKDEIDNVNCNLSTRIENNEESMEIKLNRINKRLNQMENQLSGILLAIQDNHEIEMHSSIIKNRNKKSRYKHKKSSSSSESDSSEGSIDMDDVLAQVTKDNKKRKEK